MSGALECPSEEQRPIVSLDMTEMDKIFWIDEDNLTAHIEAGIVGQDLERKVYWSIYNQFNCVSSWQRKVILQDMNLIHKNSVHWEDG